MTRGVPEEGWGYDKIVVPPAYLPPDAAGEEPVTDLLVFVLSMANGDRWTLAVPQEWWKALNANLSGNKFLHFKTDKRTWKGETYPSVSLLISTNEVSSVEVLDSTFKPW